jgi:hypothetical protein
VKGSPGSSGRAGHQPRQRAKTFPRRRLARRAPRPPGKKRPVMEEPLSSSGVAASAMIIDLLQDQCPQEGATPSMPM